MQRLGVIGIFIEGMEIGGDGIVQAIFSEMLHSLVVVFFLIHGRDPLSD
jgi:hypothetical protein